MAFPEGGPRGFDIDNIPVTGLAPAPQRTDLGIIDGTTIRYPISRIRSVIDARNRTEPTPPPGRRERILRPLRTVFSAVSASSAAR